MTSAPDSPRVGQDQETIVSLIDEMRTALLNGDWRTAIVMYSPTVRRKHRDDMTSGGSFVKRNFRAGKAEGISEYRQPFPPECEPGPISVQGNTATVTFAEPIPAEMQGQFQTQIFPVQLVRELGRWYFVPK